jgi:hypothetical protein
MPLDVACGCIARSLGLVAVAVVFTKEEDGAEIGNGDGELAYRTSMVGGTEVIANDIDEKGGLDVTVSVNADISDGSDKGEQGYRAEGGHDKSSEGDVLAWQGYHFEGQGNEDSSMKGELSAENETEYSYEDSYEGSTYGYGWQGHQLEGQGYEDSSLERELSAENGYGYEDSHEDRAYGYDWRGYQLEGQGYEDGSIEGEASTENGYGYEDSYIGSAYGSDLQGYQFEGRGDDDSSIEGESSAGDGFGYKDEGSAYGFKNYYDYYEDVTTGEHTTKCILPHISYMVTHAGTRISLL